MDIEKKIWSEYFDAVLSGKKTFEVRLADFECKDGDRLVLKEYDPDTKRYTGRKIEKTVSYVFRTKNQEFFPKEDVEKYGFQVIGFE